MKRYRVRPQKGPLRGTVRVPGDKSIGHRALIFGALGRGRSVVEGLSGGLDNQATANAFRAMGVTMELSGTRAVIDGVGLFGLKMPSGTIDCGNSGTTMRMMAGLLVAQRFGTRLVGDVSLTRRPMKRIIEPLRARGGHIAGSPGKKEGESYPPLAVAPLVEGEFLRGIEYAMPVASAQVKSALLLSGLYADGPTAVSEPVLSRDHTERMMLALGVPLETAGPAVILDPEGWDRGWDAVNWTVPGDPSSAAFLAAAAALVPGSDVTIEGVCTNPTRTGFFEVLRQMGANGDVVPQGDAAGGEPIANVRVVGSALRGAKTGGEQVTRMIDEVPILAAMAARASGATEVRDAHELRVKESDRIATMASVLRAFSIECDELPDGLVIRGGRPKAGHVRSEHDHRIAMSAAVLGLVSEGETIVDDVECVETSFPAFPALLRSLGADIVEETVEGAP